MKTIKIDNKIFEACEICEQKAEWTYMPGDFSFCDKHVPRGCTCNANPIDDNWDNSNPKNWKQETDELGRLLPCCEYWYDENGLEIK